MGAPLNQRYTDEKSLIINKNGKLYIFSSSCYQGAGKTLEPVEAGEETGGAERVDVLFNLLVVERSQPDQRLKLTQLSCFDFCAKLPQTIIEAQVTEAVRQ